MIHHIWRWIMGKPLSMDIRLRVLACVDAGHSRRAAAARFDVSASFVVKLCALRRREGSAAPARQGRPPGCKLAPFRDFLCARVDAEPDITMPELANALHEAHGIAAAPAELSRFLIKAGYTYKKIADRHGTRTQPRPA